MLTAAIAAYLNSGFKIFLLLNHQDLTSPEKISNRRYSLKIKY